MEIIRSHERPRTAKAHITCAFVRPSQLFIPPSVSLCLCVSQSHLFDVHWTPLINGFNAPFGIL
jgi:hypothetical protein